MKKRTIIRGISFASAILLILLGSTISGYCLVSRYQDTIEYSYQRALCDLSGYMDNLKATLTKSLYANTETQQINIASDLMTESQEAKASLSQLPVSENDISGLQKYFAQINDFAGYMIRELTVNHKLTDKDHANLKVFYNYSDMLASNLDDLSSIYSDGTEKMAQKISLQGNLASLSKQTNAFALDSSFSITNNEFSKFPTMLYDGPFADNMLTQKQKLSGNAVTKAEAKKIAAAFLDKSESVFTSDNYLNGNLPEYTFSGDNLYISVTKYGGYVAEYRNSRNITSTKLKSNDASKKADQFLNKNHMNSMTENYYSTSDNICNFNFVYKQNNVLCYHDLIKVGVSLDNGDVISYDATAYVMNHTARNIPKVKLSISDASKILSSDLVIKKQDMSIIPTVGGNEAYCYEFLCESKTTGDKILDYVDTQTGQEEQMFILLQSDTGTLVL
ncbi:MAG: germination protein YpeB [Bacillota bacterium]|nr:germination protein YpeB [Bacillota bacterium]